MTKPTREQKQERIYMYCDVWKMERGDEADDIDAAILADYADITPERRAELEARKSDVQRMKDDRLYSLWMGWHSEDSDIVLESTAYFDRWLAEIDAELEGG